MDRTLRRKRLKFTANYVGRLAGLVSYRNREKRQETDSAAEISPERLTYRVLLAYIAVYSFYRLTRTARSKIVRIKVVNASSLYLQVGVYREGNRTPRRIRNSRRRV